MEENRNDHTSEEIQCVHCGHVIYSANKFCPNCGKHPTILVEEKDGMLEISEPLVTSNPQSQTQPQGWFSEYFWSVVTKQFADFSGRMDRTRFWYFIFIEYGLILLTSFIIPGAAVILLIPQLAAQVRRLRDIGRNPLEVLWMFVPVLGWVVLTCYSCMPTDYYRKKLF